MIHQTQPANPSLHHANHCFPSTDCSSCGFRSLLDLAKWPKKNQKIHTLFVLPEKSSPKKLEPEKLHP